MSNLALEIERLELIRVLCRRALRVHMEEQLREMHKCPFYAPGVYEEMLAGYRFCFPHPEGK